MEHFDLTALLSGVVHSVEILMEQSGIRVTDLPNEPIYVWADEFLVEEVITNYLSNAIHYAANEKQIRIFCEQKEGCVRVNVFNSGSGIPEEDIDKIWGKFYKVDKARTREYGGSGIGLSIVKAVMESLHRSCGVYNVESGVLFWFELDTTNR
jgi:signal transduction histidine kinase